MFDSFCSLYESQRIERQLTRVQVLLIALLTFWVVPAFAQPDSALCKDAKAHVESLQQRLADAQDRLENSETCQGPGRQRCIQNVRQIQQNLTQSQQQAVKVCDPHYKPPPAPPEPPAHPNRAPYDLVWDSTDDNGFPLNPRWGKQDTFAIVNSSNQLWLPEARPRIYDDCLNAAEKQSGVSVANDYNPFRNGYCKHSPGASNYNPAYCQGDPPAPFERDGRIYCSSWSWKDVPFQGKCLTTPFAIPYHVEGHLNFSVVTYEGIVRWDNAQPEWNFDHDWCMNLYTPQGAGVSTLRDFEPWVHAEVKPEEVGDDFDFGWWQQFRDNIQSGYEHCDNLQYCQGTVDKQNVNVAPMINGKKAIIIGLLGLDMGHDDAGAELHPIYGAAIHVGGRALKGSECDWSDGHCRTHDDVYQSAASDANFDLVPANQKDDMWAIWATNFGSEGYCSSGADHVLDGDESIIGRKEMPTLTFRLPWAKDSSGRPMAAVQILRPTKFALAAHKDIGRKDAVADVHPNHGQSIQVTFHMWPSEAESYFVGELHLRWFTQPPPAPKPGDRAKTLVRTKSRTAARTAAKTAAKTATTPAPLEAEENPTAARMTPDQQSQFLAEMKKAAKIPSSTPAVRIMATIGNAAPPPPKPIAPRASTTAGKQSPISKAENAAVKKALCAAYGGKVPDAPPDFCQ